MSLQLSTSLLIAAAITTILIIRLLHKYFVRPYILLQQFKKYKGGLCIYRPVVGTIRELKTSETKYGDAIYDIKKRITTNPDLRFVAAPILDKLIITIHDAELIKQFLNKETLYTVKYMGLNGNMSEFVRNGLVFTEGEIWKRQRKLMSQVFHFDYMNNSLPMIRTTAREWIERNCKDSLSAAEPSVVNVSKELKMYTSTSLWRIFFGEDKFTENNGSEVLQLVMGNIRTGREMSFSLWYFIFGPIFFKLGLRSIDRQFYRERAEIKRLFYAKLDQLRAEFSQKKKENKETEPARFKNLIELLLGQSEGLSDMEIISQMFTFFIAGTDTTSELLSISHYLLATHPEVQTRLREEVLAHIGKTGDLTYEHVSKMEYLNAVIKEALRIGGPAIGVALRTATKDFELNDIQIKKGTVITVSNAGVAFNNKFFSNPKEFRPERWLEKVDTGTVDTSTYLPFSAGNRRCIGEQLALIESKVMLCELVRRFKIELKTPYELKMKIGIVYRADPDVHAIYTPIN